MATSDNTKRKQIEPAYHVDSDANVQATSISDVENATRTHYFLKEAGLDLYELESRGLFWSFAKETHTYEVDLKVLQKLRSKSY